MRGNLSLRQVVWIELKIDTDLSITNFFPSVKLR